MMRRKHTGYNVLGRSMSAFRLMGWMSAGKNFGFVGIGLVSAEQLGGIGHA